MTFGCFAGLTGFDCSISWIVMVLLFFLGAILRRQADSLLGMEFSLIGSTILSEIVFIIMLYITHSMKWSFLLGIVGVLVGGFIGAMWFGGGGGSEEWY